ncbi:hard-surface inducible protein [Fusarium austroafricanum]|uniref:Hard-surface inducible protein n=1 Tax=Fusarium austroafricanum TaxID=2364996 RepID=A0A8H4NTB9_9HYPO|nr:hard-surface inducible protein [Fusarium austroafricanum]
MPEEGITNPGQWVQRIKCNIRSQVGGMFVDLKGGGGHEPPVISFGNKTWETNANQHWLIFSTNLQHDSRVIIKSPVTGGYLASYGHGENIRCETGDVWDQKFHWYFEGGDINNMRQDQVVRFRSAKYPKLYLDLTGGGKNGHPFVSWEGHNGANQQYLLWFR